MGFSKLLTAFKSKDSNSKHPSQNEKHSVPTGAAHAPVSNLYTIEPLEPRLLLSGDTPLAAVVADGFAVDNVDHPEPIIQEIGANAKESTKKKY